MSWNSLKNTHNWSYMDVTTLNFQNDMSNNVINDAKYCGYVYT